MDVITLAQRLIRFNTVNPPGNEREIAEYCGALLSESGFAVTYYPYEESRLSVVAEFGITDEMPPVVLSGHLDVVPLGQKEWNVDPFAAEIIDGKLYGRGASDMKGGVAAIINAAVKSANHSQMQGGIRLILSASEEDGCKGISHLVNSGAGLGKARAVIVAEPTDNLPICAHKGALFMWVKVFGVTAHSSMPEKGINAVYKAARAVTKLEEYNFNADEDPILGRPTLNVGVFKGGLNLNSVPDKARFSIDIRSTRTINHNNVIIDLQKLFGNDFNIEVLVDKKPVVTDDAHPFVRMVDKIIGVDRREGTIPKALPYFTDGSALQEYYNGAPTIILGPGDPQMAHQTDEYCRVKSIEDAEDIYFKILTEEIVK